MIKISFLKMTSKINQQLYPKKSVNLNDLSIYEVNKSYYIVKPFHLNKYISFIVFGVTSTSDSFKYRMMIRNTWGGITKLYNSIIFFFIAKSHHNEYNSLIEKEELIYNDIIQLSFYESYFNLTILTIWMVKWIISNCKFIFFIKNDQDVIPNLYLVFTYLNSKKHINCSYGILRVNETVCRNKRLKCYIPFESYIYKNLPNYIFGYFAVYNFKLLNFINKISLNTYPIIYKEDVHMGLLASKSNYSYCKLKYKIIHSSNNCLTYLTKNRKNVIAIHGVNLYNYYKYYLLLNFINTSYI